MKIGSYSFKLRNPRIVGECLFRLKDCLTLYFRAMQSESLELQEPKGELQVSPMKFKRLIVMAAFALTVVIGVLSVVFWGGGARDPQPQPPASSVTPLPIPVVAGSPAESLLVPRLREETQKLTLNEPQARDWFGTVVAIDDDRILVGCGGDDAAGRDCGCALLFRLSDGKWIQEATLRSHDVRRHVRFGYSGAISGDVAAIGAEYANTVTIFEYGADGEWTQKATLRPADVRRHQLFGVRLSFSCDLLLVGAQQDSEIGVDGGAAYVFRRGTDGEWRQVAKLVSHDLRPRDQLGAAVAISGTTAIVGSRHNDNNTGSAYLFQPNAEGEWREVAKLKSDQPRPFGQFGISVAISGDTAVVGEWLDDDSAPNSGAAHVFERNEQGVWKHVQKLKASDPTNEDQFGYSVAVCGPRVLIGMLRLVDGKRCAGSYLFHRNEHGRWFQTVKFVPTDAAPMNKFGSSVTMTNDHAVIGAESNSTTVADGGAAYVFSLKD